MSPHTRRETLGILLIGLLTGALLISMTPGVSAVVGQPLIMGERNTSGTSQTKIWAVANNSALKITNRLPGHPALWLEVGTDATPPLRVSSPALVDNLNVDMVDGLDATAFSLDGHDHTWSDLSSGVPAGLDDGDDDTLAGLSCPEGQIAKMTASGWDCRDDLDSTDAATLDGRAADDLIRVAFDGTSDAPDADGTVLTVTITAPTAGYVVANAGINSQIPSTDGDFYSCWIELDDVSMEGSERDVQLDYVDATHTSNSQENCATTAGAVVAPGSHTIDLAVGGVDYALLNAATLWAMFVPFDGTGATAGGALVLNEVDYDQPGTDLEEFIEIYNAGPGDQSLAGIALILVNGATQTEYARYDLELAALDLAPGEFLVVGTGTVLAGLPPGTASLEIFGPDAVQNGAPDGIALFDTVNEVLLDALSYEGSITAAQFNGVAGTWNLVEGTPASALDGDASAGSLVRAPDGNDTDDADTDWSLTATLTPGTTNPAP
jgi:hypothetical protein